MDYNERLAKSQAKMDELKAKIEASSQRQKQARQLKKEEIKESMSEFDKALVEFTDIVDAKVNGFVDESVNNIQDSFDELPNTIEAFADDVDNSVQGDINAGKENARIAKERREGKINSLKLQKQMNMEARKAKITAKKDAIDKANMEARIEDLLDYADSCQVMALSWALEMETALLAASEQAAEYAEKFGENK